MLPPPVLLVLIVLCLSSGGGPAAAAAAAAAAADDLSSDVAALVALMEALAPWPLRLRHSGWTTNIRYDNVSIQEPCSWHGVTCAYISAAPEGVIGRRRIVELRLPGVGLSGTIPAATLGRLTALRVLSLRSNRLSGHLPSDLANCVELRALYLNDNLFSHTLPSFTSLIHSNSTVAVVTVPPLVRLNLADNNFSSSIPSSYALLLPHLTGLFLQNNSLTGSLPHFFDSSNNNLQLRLDNNRLQGLVPPSLQQKFGLLAFQGNNFCGAPLFAECATEDAPTPASLENAPTPSQPDDDDDVSPPITSVGPAPRTLSPGDIAAIVVAGVALALLVAACCVVWCVKRRRAYLYNNSGSSEEGDQESAKSKELKPNGVNNSSSSSRRRRGRRNLEEEEEEEEEEESAAATIVGDGDGGANSKFEKLVFMEGSPHKFGLEDLLRSSAEVLGKGPVGTAYKATLEMGTVVVVKRLRDVAAGRTDFEDHVMKVLAHLRHPNLLPLQAFYFSKEEKLLVHEYMPHGSLSSHLHAPGRQ